MTTSEKSPVLEISKNEYAKIVISMDSYKNSSFVSVRQYFKDIDGVFKPTKKGVTFPPERIDAMIDALKKNKVRVGKE